ncbi:MAG: carbon monoxide dehydrogenase [Alphaproteobacteria bacterium]|nr:carbon monoxide dehydrogenase [Alphaproteobacteria bacterium]|tara:strand:+ start:7800 stop:10151 length:2352 start_codon:yes stop_codon:yes gene_type:complete
MQDCKNINRPGKNTWERKEDTRHLTGRGQFVSDKQFDHEAFAFFVRSIHPHAKIKTINTDLAESCPGVITILTSKDIEKFNLGGIPALVSPKGIEGEFAKTTIRQILAKDKVRFVGEEVAMVIAETYQQAVDAAENVHIDYELLTSISNSEIATDPKSPNIHSIAPKNLCLKWAYGDKSEVEKISANAKFNVKLKIYNNRVSVCSMETRSGVGIYDSSKGEYTLYAGTQGVHLIRDALAEHIFNIDPERIRVITPDVGGAFGTKIWIYPEYALLLLGAKICNRPVRWTGERTESLQSDTQGRDRHSDAILSLDITGRILGLKVKNIANIGAYSSNFGTVVPTEGSTKALTGPYIVPTVYVETDVVYTNTTPTDAYRGSGRPEHSYLMERLIDVAAKEIGIDRIEIRQRNLISDDDMPYKTSLGAIYDSGNFYKILNKALEKSNWANFQQKKQTIKKSNFRRGIGLAIYVEPCGGRRDQLAQIQFNSDKSVNLKIGSQSTGQGHETSYSKILADYLDINQEQISVIQGDTNSTGYGKGTSGSRSTSIGGSAVILAAKKAVDKGLDKAADYLETSKKDIFFDKGLYTVRGTDRHVKFSQILSNESVAKSNNDAFSSDLDSEAIFEYTQETYPNGCHIAEVEVDIETGIFKILKYTCVDDFGNLIDQTLVKGQVHGAIAQGLGQAFMEHTIYDESSGQLISGSFMDYALPRAKDLPTIDWHHEGSVCQTNPLGVKGCGESGCMASPAAVINALTDALKEFQVRDIQMPATPYSIWRLIQSHHRKTC